MEDERIDVEQLMEDVGRVADSPSEQTPDFGTTGRSQTFTLDFLSPPRTKSLKVNLDLVARSWEISNEFEVGSRRKSLSWLVMTVKRFVLLLTSWFMNPLINEIRRFNMLVTRTLFDIGENIDEIKERLASLEEAEDELRLRIEEMEEDRGKGKGTQGRR